MSNQNGSPAVIRWLTAIAGIVLLSPWSATRLELPGAGPAVFVSRQDTLLAGDDAPTFVMDDLATGEPVFFADYAGQTLRQPWNNSSRNVVVLCFWASWSASCEQEISNLAALGSKLPGKPVKIFLVNTRERAGTTAEAIKSIVSERGYRLTVLLDATGTVADRYGIHSLPTTVVANKYGILKMLHSGPGSTAQGTLEGLLTSLADEP